MVRMYRKVRYRCVSYNMRKYLTFPPLVVIATCEELGIAIVAHS